jgi:O-antigen ligase
VIINFLITGFDKGFSTIDLLAVFGTLALTFFYEFGFLISVKRLIVFFLEGWVWINTVISLYLLYFVIPLYFKYRAPSGYLEVIRDNYHNSWPNQFGSYLALAILAIIFLAEKNKKYYWHLIVIFPALFFTFARTPFIALSFIVLLLFILKRKSSLTSIAGGLLVLVIILAINIVVAETKSTTQGESVEHTYYMRLYRWVAVLNLWSENPWMGIGFRSLSENVKDYTDLETGEIAELGSTHNDYVDILLRGGIVFFILFWSFVLFILITGYKRGKKNRLILYLILSIYFIMLTAVTQNPLKDAVTASIFWVYVAAIGHDCYNASLKAKYSGADLVTK